MKGMHRESCGHLHVWSVKLYGGFTNLVTKGAH